MAHRLLDSGEFRLPKGGERLTRGFYLALVLLTGALGAAVSFAVRPAPARSPAPSGASLRVCADPNNLPFSNEAGAGFENALARLVADELGRSLEYTWWPQRRGFIRSTLRAGRCDVVMGVPSDYELTLATQPYYRSTYVFVSRRDAPLRVTSLDDPELRHATIGVHVIGDDYASVPPAQALADRGLVGNVRGYSIYGDYSKPNPPAALIEAVARGEVDVAIAWGPLAGYFARRQPVPLDLRPVPLPADAGGLRFAYDISMGVRRDDAALRDLLDGVIDRRRDDIAGLLESFGVPMSPGGLEAHHAAAPQAVHSPRNASARVCPHESRVVQ